MNILIIVLRFVHILSGVFWVGGSLFLGLFVSPAVAATADAGQRFMAHLVTKARITQRITISAILTVLAGGWLYWLDSDGFTSAWQKSGPGTGFGIGAFFALTGLMFGIIVGMNTTTLGILASQIKGKPTDAQMQTIQTAQKRLRVAGPVNMLALIIALICMATARYWLF